MNKGNLTALKLAGIFFMSNLALNFLTIGVLFILGILSFIPILGIIINIFLLLVIYSYQIYIGKHITNVNSEEDIVKIAKETKLKDYLLKYLNIAAGEWIGTLIVFGVLGALYAFFGFAPLMNEFNKMSYYQNYSINGGVVLINLIFVFIFAFLFYVFPAVIGKIMKTNDFSEALKTALLLLNPKFWLKTFNFKYFMLVFIWGIIVFFGMLIGELTLIFLIGFIIIYYLGLYSAIVFVYSADIIEEKELTSIQ